MRSTAGRGQLARPVVWEDAGARFKPSDLTEPGKGTAVVGSSFFVVHRPIHGRIIRAMSSLFQLVYVSTATRLLTKEELRDLLKASTRRNARRGITGLLLYKDGNFMQVLEGEEQEVRRLFEKISQDSRHHGVITLLQGPISERYFPNSFMAFRDLDSPESKALPGYSEFLNTPLDGELLSRDLPRCQRLLLLFKKNLR